MIILTPKAVTKVKEIMESQDPKPAALRLGVQGGGCSGFQYSMQFENEKGPMDKVFVYPLSEKIGLTGIQLPNDAGFTLPETEEKLVVFVDPVSVMYLDGVTIDYLETLEASGFKFDNPNVTRTCGCGSSFDV